MKDQNIVLVILSTVGGSGVILGGLSTWIGKLLSSRIIEAEKSKHAKSIEVEKAKHALEIESEKAKYAQKLELEKARLATEIERVKSELEQERNQNQRTASERFDLYKEVWHNLEELKRSGDHLWERASRENLESFITALINARIAIDRGRLIIIEEHYNNLQIVLNKFEQYQFGKDNLIKMRSQQSRDWVYEEITEGQLTNQVQNNHSIKEDYEILLTKVLVQFKKQLGIEP